MLGKVILVVIFACLVAANVVNHSHLLELQPWSSRQQDVNITCMLNYCSKELTACVTNLNCMRGSICVVPCGSDLDCVMKCMIDYGNDVLTDFVSCTSSDHACLILPPQNPPFNCTVPKKSDSSFNYKTMPGEWHVLLGGNPTYDCFPCQLTTFNPINADGSIDALMKYRAITSSGTEKQMKQESHLVPDNARSELLHLTSNDFGNVLEDDWLVIDHEPGKYMLIYYCGRIPTGGGDYWHYEGGILYSKTTELAQDEKEKINQAASAAGINLSKWCPVSQSLCIY